MGPYPITLTTHGGASVCILKVLLWVFNPSPYEKTFASCCESDDAHRPVSFYSKVHEKKRKFVPLSLLKMVFKRVVLYVVRATSYAKGTTITYNTWCPR